MRIESIETILVDLPTIRAHVLAVATMRRQTLVLVRVRAADGAIGWGEATTIGGLSYGDESPEGIKLAIDTYIAPLIVGADAARPAAAMERVARAVVGNHFARCGVETALLDLAGRRAGLPMSEMLGGRVRDVLPVAWTLASGDTGRDIEEAREMIARRRHRVFKLKIGARAPADDIVHVSAIARALGDTARVRVDVNCAWDEITARRAIGALADAGVDLVEQPVARANHAALARLTATSPIAIMADEALHGPTDAHALAASAAAHVFAVKLAPSGGPRAALAVGAIGAAAGIGLYGGTMLEAALGTAASAHVFACLPTLAWGTELFGPLLLTEEILTEPLRYADFALTVPDGPGLGVQVDEDRLGFHRRDAARRTLSVPTQAAA